MAFSRSEVVYSFAPDKGPKLYIASLLIRLLSELNCYLLFMAPLFDGCGFKQIFLVS